MGAFVSVCVCLWFSGWVVFFMLCRTLVVFDDFRGSLVEPCQGCLFAHGF